MPFYVNRLYETQLFEYLSSMQAYNNARPVNLGGTSGPGGGGGGPPGGFLGQLPQVRVAYDTTESGSLYTPPSGMSIVTNLNHIRGRITVLEAVTLPALVATRLTTSGRNDLTPINGMLIYNTTTNKFQGYENGSWQNLI